MSKLSFSLLSFFGDSDAGDGRVHSAHSLHEHMFISLRKKAALISRLILLRHWESLVSLLRFKDFSNEFKKYSRNYGAQTIGCLSIVCHEKTQSIKNT